MPDADLKTFEPALFHRWHIGQRGYTGFAGNAINLDFAGLDVGGGIGGLVAHEIHLATEQICHRRRGAFIRHGQHVGLDGTHEKHPAQMRCGTDTGVGVRDCRLVGLHVGDQLFDVVWREILVPDYGHRHGCDEADRFEIGNGVVAQIAI